MDVSPENLFQHTAARRWLQQGRFDTRSQMQFQHTAARRRLRKVHFGEKTLSDVSTHSRPKAAAYRNGFD